MHSEFCSGDIVWPLGLEENPKISEMGENKYKWGRRTLAVPLPPRYLSCIEIILEERESTSMCLVVCVDKNVCV